MKIKHPALINGRARLLFCCNRCRQEYRQVLAAEFGELLR